MLSMFGVILKNEGVKGFYSGVFGVMGGQAIIKSVAFGTNSWALSALEKISLDSDFIRLTAAAAFAGLMSSFFVNPIERVKVLMQADQLGSYSSEIDCISKVIENDGFYGFMSRGLDATIIREVPSYALYFVTYSMLMKSAVGTSSLKDFAPLFCGASAGCLCWIPVYPFDVVKTNMQNTEGNNCRNIGFVETAIELRERYGNGIFFDGLTPKMFRAAINHAVTFYVFDYLSLFFSKL